MRNNKTTAQMPLRVSETVDILQQQIEGKITRDGSGQFYETKPTESMTLESAPIKKPARKTKKK